MALSKKKAFDPSDETGSSTIASQLDTTMNTDDVVSVASPEDDGEDEFKVQEKMNSEHHFAYLPRVKRLPWHIFVFQTFNCICPSVIYTAVFTPMGAGLQTFYYFAENFADDTYALSLGLVGAFLIFYLFDMDSWKSKVGTFLRYVFIAVVLLGLVAFCLFIAEDKPASPIAVFSLLVPLWLFFIKRFFFPQLDFRLYVSQLAGPLFTASLCHLIAFTAWAFSSPKNRYNENTAQIMRQQTGCEEDENCDTFIIYIGPVLVGLTLFFFSFFASFLHSDSPTKDITSFLKLWMILMMVFWATLSLNYGSNGLTETLIIVTFAAFAGSVFLLAASYTKDELQDQEKELWHQFSEKYAAYMDILRGLAVVLLLPVGVIYLFLSFLNQSIRKLSCPFSKSAGTHGSLFTKKTTTKLDVVKTWNIAQIISYAIYWGIGYYISFVIAAQFLTLFLGWLSELVKDLSLGVLTVIMVLVGILMFLLPPVPGVPIYMALGIVIPPVGMDQLGGLTAAYFYCVAVSLVLKLSASAMQQKLIGERLSKSVSVRKAVQVNSSSIRAVRVVLQDRGYSIAKVAILVGGPDWPTSVLAGVMGLDLFPIMVGTLPIVALIMPTVLTGTLFYMQNEKDEAGELLYPWADTMYVLMFGLTTVVQLGSSITAFIYIEKSMTTRKEEIDNVGIDEEVKLIEEAEKAYTDAYSESIQWTRFPQWVKIVLVISLLSMITSCYIVALFVSVAFAEFEMNDTIEDKLGGNWLNFIRPLGWVSMALFVVSLFFFTIYVQWARKKARKFLQESNVEDGRTSN